MNMEIDTGSTSSDRTAADAILIRLRQAGVRYLFANAGTDFASIVESMASDESGSMVEPVLVPHEAVAVAMAHGYTMVTGEPQAVMVCKRRHGERTVCSDKRQPSGNPNDLYGWPNADH